LSEVTLHGQRLATLLGHMRELVREQALAFAGLRGVSSASEEDVTPGGDRVGAAGPRDAVALRIGVYANTVGVDAVAALGVAV
jgi:hypothetical protein